jgi:hypothetical protein
MSLYIYASFPSILLKNAFMTGVYPFRRPRCEAHQFSLHSVAVTAINEQKIFLEKIIDRVEKLKKEFSHPPYLEVKCYFQ